MVRFVGVKIGEIISFLETTGIDSRLLFAIAFALIIALTIFIAGKFSRHGMSAGDRERITRAWREVTKDIQPHESHWRTAVIRADAVLDMALRAHKFSGDTMAQRLGRAVKRYTALEEAFKAHRLRNELAHNPLHTITERQTRWALKIFERALHELGM